MSDALARLRKLTEAATPGPWQQDEVTVFVSGEAYHELAECFSSDEARLIAAMRNALPLLLDLVEEADNLANMTDSHTRRHYDAIRSELEKVGMG